MSKHKVKRYDGENGSMVDAMEEANKGENLDTMAGPKAMPEEQPTAKLSSFKEAFAAARKGGGKTFEYNGKKYTTDMAGAATKAAPMVTGPGRAPTPPREKYETPYDRMNRKNSEMSAAKESTAAETARLRQRNMPASTFNASKVNPKTLLPSKGFAKGGAISSASSRADGIATKGKTRGKYL